MEIKRGRIRQRDPKCPTLYLDYDGVLHPDEVYRVGEHIVLRMDGFSLFEWSLILEELLAPYPKLQIVLATSWVRVVGFDAALSRLPEGLQRRVVGATWHPPTLPVGLGALLTIRANTWLRRASWPFPVAGD